ncbi:MAG: enoyl-CoA hydratase/isomerase family protein [Candidatus Binatia bacterium]
MSGNLVTLEVEDNVALITMNRPEKRNAFTDAMWAELVEALEATLARREARVAILTGAGGAFTAGVDLASMQMTSDASRETWAVHPFERTMELLCAFDKPLIAAADGVGVGFGLTVLLHCDFVYVTPGARFRAPFVRLGVVPEAGASYLLPAILGHRNAAEVLYAADWIDGARAVALGLAGACVASEALLPTARAQAALIAAQAPEAVRYTKRLVLETRREQVQAALARERAAFAELIGTPENLEAVTAFFQKRPPDFSNLG